MTTQTLIKQTTVKKTGYMHLCRVSGDLYGRYAIADVGWQATEEAQYGHPSNRDADRGVGYDTYTIAIDKLDSEGWTVWTEEVYNSKGLLVYYREL